MKITNKFKKGDEVYYPCDAAPFKVLTVRKGKCLIEGDFSGGVAPQYVAKDWVNQDELKPYDKFKVTYYFKGQPYKLVKQNVQSNQYRNSPTM